MQRTKQMRDFFFLLLLLLLFLEAKAGIRKSDEKNSVMRDFREKGAGMRDQDPSPSRLPFQTLFQYDPSKEKSEGSGKVSTEVDMNT